MKKLNEAVNAYIQCEITFNLRFCLAQNYYNTSIEHMYTTFCTFVKHFYFHEWKLNVRKKQKQSSCRRSLITSCFLIINLAAIML